MALSLARAKSLNAKLEYPDIMDTINETRDSISQQVAAANKRKGNTTNIDAEPIDLPEGEPGNHNYYNDALKNIENEGAAANLEAVTAASNAESTNDAKIIQQAYRKKYSDLKVNVQAINSAASATVKHEDEIKADSMLSLDEDMQYALNKDLTYLADQQMMNYWNNMTPDAQQQLRDFGIISEDDNGNIIVDYKKLEDFENSLTGGGTLASVGIPIIGFTNDRNSGKRVPIFSIDKTNLGKLGNGYEDVAFNTIRKEDGATYKEYGDAKLLSEYSGLLQNIPGMTSSHMSTILQQTRAAFNKDVIGMASPSIYNKYADYFAKAGISLNDFKNEMTRIADEVDIKRNNEIVNFNGKLTDDLKRKLNIFEGHQVFFHGSGVYNNAADEWESILGKYIYGVDGLTVDYFDANGVKTKTTPIELIDDDDIIENDLFSILNASIDKSNEDLSSLSNGGQNSEIKNGFNNLLKLNKFNLGRTKDNGYMLLQPISLEPDGRKSTVNVQGSDLYFSIASQDKNIVKLGGQGDFYDLGDKEGKGTRHKSHKKLADQDLSVQNLIMDSFNMTIPAQPANAYSGFAFKTRNGYEIATTEEFNARREDFNEAQKEYNDAANLTEKESARKKLEIAEMNLELNPVIVSEYQISNISDGATVNEAISNSYYTALTIEPFNKSSALNLTNNYGDIQNITNKVIKDYLKETHSKGGDPFLGSTNDSTNVAQQGGNLFFTGDTIQ